MRAAFVFVTLIALSSCRETGSEPETFPEAFSDQTEGCAKAVIEPLIGQDRSALAAVLLPAPVREIQPNTMITEDFRPERTNIDIDAAGRITRVWCG